MAKQPNSSSSAYATVDDLLRYYDWRNVADLINDVDNAPRPSRETVEADADGVVAAALGSASGQIESACLVAGRYQPEDLAALTGVSQKFLVKLTCDLAFWELTIRRVPDADETTVAKHALEVLDRLRLGERIFGLTETQDAGNPTTAFVTQQQIDQLNFSSTVARRYFGCRGKEQRRGY